jgi:hypothetical protein
MIILLNHYIITHVRVIIIIPIFITIVIFKSQLSSKNSRNPALNIDPFMIFRHWILKVKRSSSQWNI